MSARESGAWIEPADEQADRVHRAVAEAVDILTAAVRRKDRQARLTRPASVRQPRPPSVVSDDALLAIYRRQLAEGGPGAEAAAIRIAMLQAKLAPHTIEGEPALHRPALHRPTHRALPVGVDA